MSVCLSFSGWFSFCLVDFGLAHLESGRTGQFRGPSMHTHMHTHPPPHPPLHTHTPSFTPSSPLIPSFTRSLPHSFDHTITCVCSYTYTHSHTAHWYALLVQLYCLFDLCQAFYRLHAESTHMPGQSSRPSWLRFAGPRGWQGAVVRAGCSQLPGDLSPLLMHKGHPAGQTAARRQTLTFCSPSLKVSMGHCQTTAPREMASSEEEIWI